MNETEDFYRSLVRSENILEPLREAADHAVDAVLALHPTASFDLDLSRERAFAECGEWLLMAYAANPRKETEFRQALDHAHACLTKLRDAERAAIQTKPNA